MCDHADTLSMTSWNCHVNGEKQPLPDHRINEWFLVLSEGVQLTMKHI